MADVGGGCEEAALKRKRSDYGHGGFVQGHYGGYAVNVGTVRPSALALRNSAGCFDVESYVHAITSSYFLQ